MTVPKTTTRAAEPEDEAARLRRIAEQHRLSPDGLVDFIVEIRRQARNRRRRLTDNQIEAFVTGLQVEP